MFRQTKLATQTQTVAETIAESARRTRTARRERFCLRTEEPHRIADGLAGAVRHGRKGSTRPSSPSGLAEQTVARVLARIDHASEQDPARLVLPAAVTGPLRDLMERRSGVEAALAAAEAEVDKAVEALSRGRSEDRRTVTVGFDEATTGALTAAIAMARQVDDVARSRAADRICRERADELADRLIELLPWTGDRNTLCAASGADARPTSALGIGRSGPFSRNRLAARRGGSPRRRGRTPRCENRCAPFRGRRRQRQGRRRSSVRPRSRLGHSQSGVACRRRPSRSRPRCGDSI